GGRNENLSELRDPFPRDDRILDKAPGPSGSGTLDDRRKDGPAEFPERGLSVRVLGDLDGATHLVSSGDRSDHVGDDPSEIPLVEFDEEHGRGAGRYAMGLAADQVQRSPIDGFHGTWLEGEEVCDERAEFPEAVEIQ